MDYLIDINNSDNDGFETNSDNVLSVKVFDKENRHLKDCYVELFLTKNGMLGLGTELIRLAHKFHEGKHIHLDPCDKDLMVQRLGVFVSPDSNSLIIDCDKNITIDELCKNIN